MALRLSRREYDYCSAEVSFDAMEQMKPETRDSSGSLNGETAVEVLYNGNLVQKLMFRGDFVEYGERFAELELKDLHKSLSKGEIDIQRKSLNVKEAYKLVLSKADSQFFADELDDSNFTLPENTVTKIYGEYALPSGGSNSSAGSQMGSDIESDPTKKLLDSSYALDISGESPERAFQILHENFGLTSWVNREGKLIIGVPEVKKQLNHVAAPDDSRVWRFKNPSITTNREPIKQVTVEGAWKDAPGLGGWDDIVSEMDSWTNDDNEQGGADARAVGYAENVDVDYGKRFTIKSTRGKKDALENVAELFLIERMKKTNSGTVTIDPVMSGTKVSHPIDTLPGHILRIVPEDDYFDEPTSDSGSISNPLEDTSVVCGGYVNNEEFLIKKVQHQIDNNGRWTVELHVTLYPSANIETSSGFFGPDGEKIEEGGVGGVFEDGDNDGGEESNGEFGFGLIEDDWF